MSPFRHPHFTGDDFLSHLRTSDLLATTSDDVLDQPLLVNGWTGVTRGDRRTK
jgi:hypothetical protein